MNQSKALQRIAESMDLIGMIQDLTDPRMIDSLSPSSWAGLRLTLKAIKENLAASHESFAKELVASANVSQRAETKIIEKDSPLVDAVQSQALPTTTSKITASDTSAVSIKRRDLITSLERFVDRG